MFPSLNSPISRLKLALSLSMQICFLFGLLIIIFSSAMLIPNDIESRRIYTILPKPITRIQYIIGKVFGIFLLALSLLLVFAFIVILYVRLTYISMDKEYQQSGNSFFSVINPYSISDIKRYRNNKYVGNAPAHAFEIEIDNFDANDYDEKITLKFIASYKKQQLLKKISLDIDMIERDSGALLAKEENLLFDDKKLSEIRFPIKKSNYSKRAVLIRFNLTKNTLDSVGGVLIEKNNIFVHRKAQSFELNIIKVFLVIACQLTLVGIVALTASTRLSYYISAFFALTLFFAGFFRSFLLEYMSEKQFQVANEIINTNTWSFKISHFSEQYMMFICKLMPDFSKFDVTQDLANGIALNFIEMKTILWSYFLYFLIYLLLAVFSMWKREV